MIQADGVNYLVVDTNTAEQYEEKGLRFLAKHMRMVGIARWLIARRPNGKKFYMIPEYINGKYGTPINCP